MGLAIPVSQAPSPSDFPRANRSMPSQELYQAQSECSTAQHTAPHGPPVRILAATSNLPLERSADV